MILYGYKKNSNFATNKVATIIFDEKYTKFLHYRAY